MNDELRRLLTMHRIRLEFGDDEVRAVYRSALANSQESYSLSSFLANKAVGFYRPISSILADLKNDFPLSTFKETLARMPRVDSFRRSHFGEIVACLFAEDILGLRRLYSKLSLLTAENSNAHKMDLLLYDPRLDPVQLVLAEVKSSPKASDDGLPVGHDKSCFADIFDSLRKYDTDDLEFDLAAAKDQIRTFPEHEQERIRKALQPYRAMPVQYAAFAVIDDSTFHADEANVLGSRKSPKEFEVDVVGITGYKGIAEEVFERLSRVLDALKEACS